MTCWLVFRQLRIMKSHIILLLGIIQCVLGTTWLRRVHEWRTIRFFFPNATFKQRLIDSGQHIMGAATPLDVDVIPYDVPNIMFVTTPRLHNGTAATLSIIRTSDGLSPVLYPYPSWDWHMMGNCDGITSTFRVSTDYFNRLWVLDTGVIDVLGTAQRICQPQIIIFNTVNNSPILRYRFPDSVIPNNALLVTIAVDVVNNNPANTFAYIADPVGHSLTVYSMASHSSWQVNSQYFYPVPGFGTFYINQDRLDLMDGLLALSLSPPLTTGDRYLYFHSLSSDTEGRIRTSVLQNPANFLNGNTFGSDQIQIHSGRRRGPSAPSAMDESGVQFFGTLPTTEFNCWNSRLPYNLQNIETLDFDPIELQFITGIKIRRNRSGQEIIYVLSDRFQKVATNRINPNDVNFRIFMQATSALPANSSCRVGPRQ